MNKKYTLNYTGEFRKDLKLCKKRGYNISLFEKVSKLLETTGTLPPEYHPHKLSGKYEGLWECHIQSTGYWFGIKMIRNLCFCLQIPALMPICFNRKIQN